jgi:hypothetical protein
VWLVKPCHGLSTMGLMKCLAAAHIFPLLNILLQEFPPVQAGESVFNGGYYLHSSLTNGVGVPKPATGPSKLSSLHWRLQQTALTLSIKYVEEIYHQTKTSFYANEATSPGTYFININWFQQLCDDNLSEQTRTHMSANQISCGSKLCNHVLAN